MLPKAKEWYWGLGATGATIFTSAFSTGPGCNGMCGACGGTCIGGLSAGLGLAGLYCYRKFKRQERV
ncbi:MAG: hypothetical protein RSD70_07410, partial [Acidaminococcaceae bacterium]